MSSNSKIFFSFRNIALLKDSISEVDFSKVDCLKEINDLVQNTTGIKDVTLTKLNKSAANAVLANAAYFKGIWATGFDDTLKKATFNTFKGNITVEMMHVKAPFKYGSSKQCIH